MTLISFLTLFSIQFLCSPSPKRNSILNMLTSEKCLLREKEELMTTVPPPLDATCLVNH